MKTKTDQHTDLTTRQFYTILYDRIKLDMAKKSLKVNMETLAPDNLKNICKALKISVGIVYRLKTKN